MSDSETKRDATDRAPSTATPSEPPARSDSTSPSEAAHGSSDPPGTTATSATTESERDEQLEAGAADRQQDTTPGQQGAAARQQDAADRQQGAAPGQQGAVKAHAKEPKDRRWLDRGTLIWLGVVAVVFAVELFIYGHAGIIRVCVGLEGQTDFSLLDQRNPQASPRSHPFCAERRNIGMYPNAEEAAREALEEACQRGATLTRGDQRACLRREKGWTRRVDRQNLPPWDERVYRRLLWLD